MMMIVYRMGVKTAVKKRVKKSERFYSSKTEKPDHVTQSNMIALRRDRAVYDTYDMVFTMYDRFDVSWLKLSVLIRRIR